MTTQLETQNPKLEYLNSFAAIFEDGFLIHQYNSKTPIHVSKLDKVFINKKRKAILNWLFLIGTIICSIVYYFNPIKSIIATTVFATTLLILLCLTFFLKKYTYSFIIIFLDGEIVKIKLNKNSINDAKQVFKQMQKILKEHKKSIINSLAQ